MKELRENKTTPSVFGGYSIKDQMDIALKEGKVKKEQKNIN